MSAKSFARAKTESFALAGAARTTHATDLSTKMPFFFFMSFIFSERASSLAANPPRRFWKHTW